MGLKNELWLEYCAKHNFDVEKLVHKDIDTLVRFLSRIILHCEGYYEDMIPVTKQDIFALNSRGRSLFFEMAKVQCSGNNVRKEIPINYIAIIRDNHHITESDVKDNFLSLFVPNSKRTGDVIDIVMKMYPECRTVSKHEALEAAAKCHQHSGVMEVLHKHMIFKEEDLVADDWAILSVAMRHENVGAVKWLQKMAPCPLDHPLWVQFLHSSNDIGDFYREHFMGYDTTLIKEYLEGDDATKRNCIQSGILEGKNMTITWMFHHFASTKKVVNGQQLLHMTIQRDCVSMLILEVVRHHFPMTKSELFEPVPCIFKLGLKCENFIKYVIKIFNITEADLPPFEELRGSKTLEWMKLLKACIPDLSPNYFTSVNLEDTCVIFDLCTEDLTLAPLFIVKALEQECWSLIKFLNEHFDLKSLTVYGLPKDKCLRAIVQYGITYLKEVKLICDLASITLVQTVDIFKACAGHIPELMTTFDMHGNHLFDLPRLVKHCTKQDVEWYLNKFGHVDLLSKRGFIKYSLLQNTPELDTVQLLCKVFNVTRQEIQEVAMDSFMDKLNGRQVEKFDFLSNLPSRDEVQYQKFITYIRNNGIKRKLTDFETVMLDTLSVILVEPGLHSTFVEEYFKKHPKLKDIFTEAVSFEKKNPDFTIVQLNEYFEQKSDFPIQLRDKDLSVLKTLAQMVGNPKLNNFFVKLYCKQNPEITDLFWDARKFAKQQ